MPDLHEGRRDTVLIITAMIMIKLASLAFIHAVVGGSVLEQLSTKWDSVYYVGIAQNGYPVGSVTANYAFAPGYPSLIWLASLAVGNYLLSAAIVSNVFSVLAVLAFYRLSRMYFGPLGSLCASLAFGFFPTFVTYGLVSYSEPVYLFFAILAVYFFLNARYFYTGVTSSLAVLSGYASLLIAPIFLSIIILRLILPRLKP
ncbi:MAG: glycosyltransferase family 39 protein, partial [Nitrososphaerota archaeon]|nr:glycosyltransferase family 39 protein [Nitrososphaerota archaeon]